MNALKREDRFLLPLSILFEKCTYGHDYLVYYFPRGLMSFCVLTGASPVSVGVIRRQDAGKEVPSALVM